MRLVDIDKSIESVKNLIRNGATIEQALDAQPTAYDPEEVVKQLKEKSFPDFEEEYTCNGGLLLHYDDVIEIVRKGGVK